MREIGVNAYRLSVSWPRVIPAGAGAINSKGLGFYDRLIDELLAKEIEPWVTLFHWDYPYELFLRGGWLNPDSPKWFSDYVEVVVDRLSDRVDHWITLNEPQCFLHLGHSVGEHAPGLKLGLHEVLLATHHTLLAHGLGVQAIRARAKKKPNVGWAPVGWFCYPVSDKPEDIEASRQATMQVKDGWNTCWYADPGHPGPLSGRWPQNIWRRRAKVPGVRFGNHVPAVGFLWIQFVHRCADTRLVPTATRSIRNFPPGHGHTLFLWKVTPEILHWGPKFMAERYKLPIVITENGMSNSDWVALDGTCP